MQHDPRDARELVDDRGEQLPAHIPRRLEVFESARAGGAEQVAAVRRLQIEADGIFIDRRAQPVGGPLEIAPRVRRGGRQGSLVAHPQLAPEGAMARPRR